MLESAEEAGRLAARMRGLQARSRPLGHELRGPLQGAMMRLELALGAAPAELPELLDAVKRALAEQGRALAAVWRLLEPESDGVDLAEVAGEAAEVVRLAARGKAQLTVDPPAVARPLPLPASWLRHLLCELLTALAERGSVHVSGCPGGIALRGAPGEPADQETEALAGLAALGLAIERDEASLTLTWSER